MYHLFQLGYGGSAVHQGRNLLYQIGSVGPEDMAADDAAVFVGNEFAQTVGLAHAHLNEPIRPHETHRAQKHGIRATTDRGCL